MRYREWSDILEFCIATEIIWRSCLRDKIINVLCCVSDTKGFIRKSHGIILDTSTCIQQFMTTAPKIYVAFSLKVYLSASTYRKSKQEFLMAFIIHIFYSALCNVTCSKVRLRRRNLISNFKAGAEISFINIWKYFSHFVRFIDISIYFIFDIFVSRIRHFKKWASEPKTKFLYNGICISLFVNVHIHISGLVR
jgi:hypothetical protein